jgi:MFS family permease
MRRPSYTRNVSVLATCQALFFMCNTIIVSTAPLVGLQYAPSPALATLPLGVQFLGAMTCTMPASLLMKELGRRNGLAIGMVLGIVAGLTSLSGVIYGNFVLFCLGGVVYGAFSSFCQYFRFTAADAADASSAGSQIAAARGRAISWVMAGGLVAAVLGPELAKHTQDLLPPFLFAGCYATVAILAALALLAILFLDLPPLSDADRSSRGRPLGEIARQPAAIIAFAAALVGYVTMNLVMTGTPLAMVACGFGFADSAFVIQWHVLGMFAPSFVTGHLIARFGVYRVMAAGVLLNIACVAVAVAGLAIANFAVALFLLGMGWNFMFVGATTLLTTCHTPAEKAKVQGFNDLLIFTCVAASAILSGVFHEFFGWSVMNLLTVPGLLLVALLVVPRAMTRPAATAV